MRILVAGATSTLGLPTVSELVRRGHEVSAMTRDEAKAPPLRARGTTPVIGDVNDREGLQAVLRSARPEAVVSLLIDLPHRGPRRASDFETTTRLWREGVPNLLDAAAEVGVRKVVAESVVFAYGYGRYGTEPMHETDQPARPPMPPEGAHILAALHGMERRVLGGDRFDGCVLRYGMFHGPSVPSTRLMLRLLRWRLPLVPGQGDGLLPWIEITDAARATADAVERGAAGELYNVVDDEPVSFERYAGTLAEMAGLPRPRRLPRWLARMAMPYAAFVLGYVQLPLSNRKARNELGWEPEYPTYREVARLIADELGGPRG